jgi:hypothetical protein
MVVVQEGQGQESDPRKLTAQSLPWSRHNDRVSALSSDYSAAHSADKHETSDRKGEYVIPRRAAGVRELLTMISR